MRAALEFVRRSWLPAAVFCAILGLHYGWFALSSPDACEVSRGTSSPLHIYLAIQAYWIGMSYALLLAFAARTLQRYREEKLCPAPKLAIGGVTLPGLAAVAGCSLLGCCGSPLLAVYLGLFGTAFLPAAKPLVFGLTVLWVAGASWWLRRKSVAV